MTFPTIFAILLLSILSGLTTLIGVKLALWFHNNKRIISGGLGFASGIMVIISLLQLLPNSIKISGFYLSFMFFLIGVVTIFLANKLIPHTHVFKKRFENKSDLIRVAYLCAIGLIMHDIPEGFAMANSYIFSAKLGVFVALAIAIHNIPEQFAIALPLILAKNKKLLYKIAFISALAEPTGAILGILMISVLPFLNSFLMAFTAGIMLYIALHELIPTATKYVSKKLFIFGFIISTLIYFLLLKLLPI